VSNVVNRAGVRLLRRRTLFGLFMAGPALYSIVAKTNFNHLYDKVIGTMRHGEEAQMAKKGFRTQLGVLAFYLAFFLVTSFLSQLIFSHLNLTTYCINTSKYAD
jgi:hypothetical protein